MRFRRPGPLAALALVALLVGGPVPPGTAAGHAAAPLVAGIRPLPSIRGVGPGVLDPSIAGDGVGKILVNSTDPAATPNTGMLLNLTGFRMEPFPNVSSLQVGANLVIGPYLASFGLFQNDPGGAYPYFAIFNNTTGARLVDRNMSLVRVSPGDACDFRLEATNGTNWTLDYNGLPFGFSRNESVFDFGAASAGATSWVDFAIVVYSIGAVVPSLLQVPTAMGVRTPSGWYLPRTATAVYLGANATAWGIQGQSQNASLYPGELASGTSLPPLPGRPTVWDGAPEPGTVTVASSPTTILGTATTNVTAVASVAGTPLPGLPVAYSDVDGGSFVPPDATTAAGGVARASFVAPNVSASEVDRLFATSRILGLDARGSVAVNVTAALVVTLTAEGLASLAPGGTLAFRVDAAGPSGAPIPGLFLQLSLVGAGAILPVDGLTDPQGGLAVEVAASRVATSLTVIVNVDAPGYFGLLRIVLPVTTPAPSLGSQLVGLLPWFIVAALVGVVVAVYLRRRLPKTVMVPMSLRGRPPVQAPPVPASPTPPSGDGPPPGPPPAQP